jgi:hypothetical protein
MVPSTIPHPGSVDDKLIGPVVVTRELTVFLTPLLGG